MRKLASISPGTIFDFAGEKFVVLDQCEGMTFVLLAQSKVSCPFNDKENVEDRNNYIGSTLEERINQWVERLPRTKAEAAAILPFEVDLSCTDRSASYGTITVKAAPLTLWQYGQFKELIPLNEDDWWWLVTPWACRWLRSPRTGSTNGVWGVGTDGGCGSRSASYSGGIRPALLLNSELLVSVEGDENEGEGCECDSPYVDLSKVDTLALIREVERRLSHGEAYGADSQDTEGESE